MVLNEVVTQVTGISVDILEHIGNKFFDESTDETGISPADFPLVTFTAELTGEGGFGNTGDGATCDHTNFYDPDCNDIDDFHGITLNRTVEGIPYTAVVSVDYVDEDNPDTDQDPDLPHTRTFAKMVTVTITSPYLLLGNIPLEVKLHRVFTYNRITS